jgi:hypothetical protein
VTISVFLTELLSVTNSYTVRQSTFSPRSGSSATGPRTVKSAHRHRCISQSRCGPAIFSSACKLRSFVSSRKPTQLAAGEATPAVARSPRFFGPVADISMMFSLRSEAPGLMAEADAFNRFAKIGYFFAILRS